MTLNFEDFWSTMFTVACALLTLCFFLVTVHHSQKTQQWRDLLKDQTALSMVFCKEFREFNTEVTRFRINCLDPMVAKMNGKWRNDLGEMTIEELLAEQDKIKDMLDYIDRWLDHMRGFQDERAEAMRAREQKLLGVK